MKRKEILLICFVLATAMFMLSIVEGGYYFIRGLSTFRGGFEGESIKHLENSIKTNPNFLEAYMLLALAYTEWGSSSKHYIEYDEEGLARLKTETVGKAEGILKTALGRFPYHYLRDDMQYMLARIYDEDTRNTGYVWDKDKAIQGYTQLVSEYPHSKYTKKARERIEVLTK